MAGNDASKLSGRFIPPQPNGTNNSSQDTDNSNTTTVYYENSTCECHVVVCKGRGYNFYILAPCGRRLFNSHMTYDVTSCTYDVTSGV